MIGEFGKKEQQYECVTKFGLSQDDAIKLQQYQANGRLYAYNSDKEVLYQLLLNAGADAGKNKTKQNSTLSTLAQHKHCGPEMTNLSL